jgi:hypothetical protein
MSLIIVCPSCGSKLKVPDNFAGRRAKCSKCGNPISIPATGEPEVAARPAPKVVPAPQPVNPKPKERYELGPQEEYGPEPQKPEAVETAADENRPKRRKKKKQLKTRPSQGIPTWLWWASGCLSFLLATLVAVVIAVRAGFTAEVIFFGVYLAVMLPCSTVILIISMIISSHLSGGIDFGEVHVVIPKALALLFVTTLISMIPYAGLVLTFPVWLLGLMYLFRLDFWEGFFLVSINWLLNLIAKVFLVAIVIGIFLHGKPDLIEDEPLWQKPGNVQQKDHLDVIEEMGGSIDMDEDAPGMPVLGINFAGSRELTDAGLAHVKGLTTLRSLDLSRTRVTDAGLVHLTGLNQLQILNLTGTKVTDAGVRSLQKALPRVKIVR